MDTQGILEHLRAERDRLDTAIYALEGRSKGSAPRARATAAKKHVGGITAAGRRRLSQMMKARWAARRKAAAGKTAAAKVTAVKKK